MNQKAFSFGLHRFERSHFSGTKSNFPSVISRVFDLRQIREWKKNNNKSRMACEKAEAFRRTFFHSWMAARSSERGFSSKAAPVTLPILLPIKIYREHPGKRCKATIITTCLSSTNKHTNHGSPNKKGKSFLSCLSLQPEPCPL